MKKILAPDEYFLKCLQESILYTNYVDLENARFSVMDSILNTVGNGIDTSEDLLEALSVTNIDLKSIEEIEKDYFDDKYVGFKKIIIYHEDGTDEETTVLPENLEDLVFTGCHEGVVLTVLEKDKSKHEDVIYWKKAKRPSIKWNPYPNFQKEYSAIYKVDLNVLGDKRDVWIDEIITFYNDSIAYLESESSRDHSYAYPSNKPQGDERLIASYKKSFEKYNSNEEISKAYEAEFDGDVEAFAARRWENNKSEWINFSKEAIKYLEKMKK